MKNRINLSKYNIRTDLVIDQEIQEKNTKVTEINKDLKVTEIEIDKKQAIELNRKAGIYITIEFKDATNHEDKIEIEKCLTSEISKLLKRLNIKKEDEGIIIGLGNRFSTADSLGPKCIDKILITRHLFQLKTNVKKGIRSISAITPGVMANTGIESFEIIESIIKKIKPKFIIAIDALASSSIDRINKTIQLTDTGIHPGSGIGNNRKELSKDTLNIPIISIGIPTVVESSIIVNDTINYLFKHISYLKNNLAENKLIINRSTEYKNKIKNLELNPLEKKEISGIIGTLSEPEKKALISEVLKSIHYDLIVTPKEIDFLIDNLSEILANSINKSLHPALNDWQIKIF